MGPSKIISNPDVFFEIISKSSYNSTTNLCRSNKMTHELCKSNKNLVAKLLLKNMGVNVPFNDSRIVLNELKSVQEYDPDVASLLNGDTTIDDNDTLLRIVARNALFKTLKVVMTPESNKLLLSIALKWAVVYNNLEIIGILDPMLQVPSPAEIEIVYDNIEWGNNAEVKNLILNQGININHPKIWAPLFYHHAVNNSSSMVRLLHQLDIDINAFDVDVNASFNGELMITVLSTPLDFYYHQYITGDSFADKRIKILRKYGAKRFNELNIPKELIPEMKNKFELYTRNR